MPNSNPLSPTTLVRDLTAGAVVFLVALPLCLGIAKASDAPYFAGLVGGIIGGLLVGLLSGSHTSVSGPAAGLTAVVAYQIGKFGFDAFLLAVLIAGVIQIILGVVRAGFIAAFFPSSVIKGLLGAIGVILILKQIPHILGHDTDPEGDMAFDQPDHENTFSEFIATLSDLHPGAIVIGVLCIGVLIVWDLYKPLKYSKIPAPLVVVVLGLGLKLLFDRLGAPWSFDEESNHLVSVPEAKTFGEFCGFFQFPDFSQWRNPAIYGAAFTLAAVASLETLLNLEAVDKLDPRQRVTPASRELVAQGIGNIASGLIGGLPLTAVIVRGSVNINAGAQTKLSAIVHGVLLLLSVMLLPTYLNQIPLACLAAILLVTGIKLASPALVRRMWNEGPYQFVPFIITLLAIVFTDLLIGTLIGLGISVSFILASNLRRPVRRVLEKHIGGEVLHIEFANQVSFLNRAALQKILREIPRGGHVLLDAQNTDYIDPDILDLIRDFKEQTAPAHGVHVSFRGFRSKYRLEDDIQFVDYSTRELQEKLTPEQVLQLLIEGNDRFRTGHRLTRDLGRQLDATARGQHPLAVVLSCIDSRTPAEIIFDLGLGDIFSVRIAGNVPSPKILGSIEYGCAVAGAKLVLVVGHTRCGAVTAAVDFLCSGANPEQATGCQHLEGIVRDIQRSVDVPTCQRVVASKSIEEKDAMVDTVAARNARQTVQRLLVESRTIRALVEEKRIAVVAAIYDVVSGKIDVLPEVTDGTAIQEPVGHYYVKADD